METGQKRRGETEEEERRIVLKQRNGASGNMTNYVKRTWNNA